MTTRSPMTPIQRDAFVTAFRFYDRWRGIPATAEAWIALAEDVTKIAPQCNGNRLLLELMVAVINVLDSESKPPEATQTEMTIDGWAVRKG